MPGDWNVGDRVEVVKNGELIVRGRIKEILGDSLYKIEVEEGGIRARRKK
jgi:non-ribosomal peptide synthetase component E (peptide arylation enzyme)